MRSYIVYEYSSSFFAKILDHLEDELAWPGRAVTIVSEVSNWYRTRTRARK